LVVALFPELAQPEATTTVTITSTDAATARIERVYDAEDRRVTGEGARLGQCSGMTPDEMPRLRRYELAVPVGTFRPDDEGVGPTSSRSRLASSELHRADRVGARRRVLPGLERESVTTLSVGPVFRNDAWATMEWPIR